MSNKANSEKADEAESFGQPRLLTFPEPRALARTDRASAMVFEDPESRRLLAHIERISPSDATVLIIGETGTGKELIARHIHALSQRSGAPFGALNCTALSESLIESELFGHEKGAFTGAIASKPGWFETAHGGTLLLDEVGDLPMSLQAKLLRVLQEREVVRVGSRQPTPVDVRVIAATNVNLEEAVLAGRFRADLYYRFNVAVVRLVPLKDRPLDILPLARHFLWVYAQRLGYAEADLTTEAEHFLLAYDWPGNIRELENAIHHALLVCPGDRIRPEDFRLSGVRPGGHVAKHPSRSSLETALQNLYEGAPPKLFAFLEETIIRTAFEFCEKNQVQTAKLLDISRNVLRHRLACYGYLVPRKRDSQSDFESDDESFGESDNSRYLLP